MICSKLKIQNELNRDIERAHRVGNLVQMRPPTANRAILRAIMVRFWNYKGKENIIQAAWKQRIMYEGRYVYFNQDFTAEVQKQRERVRDVIKKLKERNVKAQMCYPAQLRIFLDGETKTFVNLRDAAALLRKMDIFIEEENETDKLKKDLLSSCWKVVTTHNTSELKRNT